MKNFILLTGFFISHLAFSQIPQPQLDKMNFEPGELIVKLKDDVNAQVTYASNGKAMTNFNISEFLGIEDKIASSSVMFHQKTIEASVLNKQKMKQLYTAKAAANPNNGYVPKEPLSMKNVFVLKTNNVQENILQLIEEIKDNPNVEYAEPNYIFKINDYAINKIITAEEALSIAALSSTNPLTPNDPLYSAQTNITATNIDDVWGTYTTGDSSQIIAILDTGVDYNHPDLAANKWINQAEANGVPGFDDDGNGFVDDIHGWDFINVDNAPLDDNMHGTHVAGIAGAVGDNGIGIAGAAWNVKLMPIKVFQSNGQGNSTTIAAGVEYAINNGATILNMSFGSYAESSTLRLALENAYATAILVAAAGNNGICIGPGLLCFPFYPAAYNFVLGIQDFPLPPTGYTNFDQDGPIASGYANLLNYELKAPGTQIMSTIPNGGYANLTGTSMAAPLVAGALALYKQEKPNESKELMFGNLINTATASYADFYQAMGVVPEPKLAVISAITRDTINNQNGNGVIQPGETIEILPLIKNFWGPTTDVRVGIAFAPFEDQTKATIVQDEIQIGSISAYATLQDLQETLKITIANNVANNVNIRFILTAWSGPNQDAMSDAFELVINVKNSILLFGLYQSDLTLYPDTEYLVVNNFVMAAGTTLTILPGVELYISDGKSIMIQGDINAIGTTENRILFAAENSSWNGFKLYGNSFFEYCIFKNINTFDDIFDNWFGGAYIEVEKSIFFDNKAQIIGKSFGNNHNITKSNFYENLWFNFTTNTYNQIDHRYTHSNFVNNLQGGSENGPIKFWIEHSDNFAHNNIFNNKINGIGELSASASASNYNTTLTQPNYFGSSDQSIINSYIIDFFDDSNLGVMNTNNSFQPSELANGIVWKVLVNDKDAQDEYHLMDPVGIGTHEFKVYFNRAMDTLVRPQIYYGVINPYNQKIITEQGTWSSDGKIYTVNHEIKIGAADGINRIRVQDAQDLDNFKIPIEASRFNMLVQSAGSASTGFFATPGLGKIDLQWQAPTEEMLTDALGYNMFRYQMDENGNETTPIKLNSTLIFKDPDPSVVGVNFTDFNVTEGQTYFYKYKILRTSLEETDFSQTVSASPLTSLLGDSNGDFTVNVLDLVHNVDYILGNNPTPFIFLAADVNADQVINVLDIVGTVDIILNPGNANNNGTGSTDMNFYPNIAIGNAIFSWEGNDLYVESDHRIGGLQLAFDANFNYTIAPELSSIERLDYIQEEAKIVMLFSFNNTIIAQGKTKILTRENAFQELNIEKAVVGTTGGSKLTAVFKNVNLEDITAPMQSEKLEFLSITPNPSVDLVTLEYLLPDDINAVKARVFDMFGRLVHIQPLSNKKGTSKVVMELSRLTSGQYIVLISAQKNDGVIYIANKKLIVK